MRHSGYCKLILLFVIFFALKTNAQSKRAKLISDTTFKFYSLRYCEISSDTSVYKNEKMYPEDYYFTVHKIKGEFFLEKSTYHNDYSTDDGNGHIHAFKPVKLDSFPPLSQSWTDIVSIKNDKIKPFITYVTDSIGKKHESQIYSSHDCIFLIAFQLNGVEIETQVPTFPIKKEFVFDSEDGSRHFIESNSNYSYNQSLNSVKIVLYMQELILHLENEKKFVLID